jgi:hypothetical protein
MEENLLATYSFKKEAKVYIVYGGNQYNIDISTINFSQTFTEVSYDVKTLQSQNAFEGSIIHKANPANFSFTFPAIREDDLEIVFDRALDYQTFDLYISTQQDVFKIENCVITNGAFIIEKLKPLSMAVSGQASQLTRAGDFGVYTIPGSVQARAATRTYNRISDLSITLGGSTVLSNDLVSVSIELRNNIKWSPYTTVPETCGTISAASYPTTFTMQSRTLGGQVVRYLTDTNNADLQSYDLDTTLLIEAGQDVGGTVYGFTLNITNCMFVNLVNPGNVFTQNYNWRMIQNPTNLSDIITYTTL